MRSDKLTHKGVSTVNCIEPRVYTVHDTHPLGSIRQMYMR